MTDPTQPWPRGQRMPLAIAGQHVQPWHMQAIDEYDAAHNTTTPLHSNLPGMYAASQINQAIKWWNERAETELPALLLAELAPHGGFNIHVSDNTRGPNNELAVHVICACGRGYSWERKIPAAELIAWLLNHGPDIPLEEEERRVKAAGGREAAP